MRKNNPRLQDRSFYVEGSYACGIVTINYEGLVINTIPPFMFMVRQGMNWKELEAYCKTRGWRIRPMEQYQFGRRK